MKTSNLPRRDFIQKGFLGLGVLSLTSISAPINTGEKAFLTESGNLGRDKKFSIGCLCVKNVGLHENAITSLREKHNYRSRLSYSSTDRYRMPFLKEVLAHLVNSHDFTFFYFAKEGEIKVKTKAEFPSHRQILNKRNEFFAQVLEGTNLNKSTVKVEFKVKSSFGPSAFAINDFKEKTGYKLVPSSSIKNDLLQLSGLLTGTIARIASKQTVTTKKQETIDAVQSLIGLRKVSKGRSYLDGRIKIL